MREKQFDLFKTERDPAPLLAEVIAASLAETGLRKSVVVARWGYKNTGKGLRRLDELAAGDFVPPTSDVLPRLAAALEADPRRIAEAFAATHRERDRLCRQEKAKEWESWCARFEPHAVLTTEHVRPTSITMVALVGPERFLRIDVDPMKSEETWPAQILSKLPTDVPFFGRVTGFTLNYAPHRAIDYDLAGQVVARRSEARRPGRGSVFIKGVDIAPFWRRALRD